MSEQVLETLVADAGRALGDNGKLMGSATTRPRFELFSAPNSICSQKVRCVLAYHGIPYISHSINLFKGESYLPEYVRLRMRGCDRLGPDLAIRHNGSSSAAAGCDPAVVPTLVDWEVNDVFVDSKRVSIYLDDLMPEETKLRPKALKERIDEQLSVVDHMPNYQMLMARDASAETETKADIGSHFSARKIVWCDDYLEQYANDPTLVRAYTAKRAKEVTSVNDLFQPKAIDAAYERAEQAIIDLGHMLEKREGHWMFGDKPTMADIFWGIEILRVRNMKAAYFWENGRLPEVERFVALAETMPAIRTGVLEWPGAEF